MLRHRIILTLTWNVFVYNLVQINALETCDQNNNCFSTQDNYSLQENDHIFNDEKFENNKNEELLIKSFNNEIIVDSNDLKKELILEENKGWVEDNKDVFGSEVIENNEEVMSSENVLEWMGLDVMKVFSLIIPDEIESVLKHLNIWSHLFVLTSIIAFNLSLMKVIIFVFQLSKKETKLRDISCRAQRKVYYFEAEKQKLETELENEREKSEIVEKRMQTAEHKAFTLEKEFKKIKTERDQFQHKVINLENELENTTEAGLELNKLLNDFLTSQKENVNLNSSIESLQQQITKQAETVAKYETLSKQKEKENSEYKKKLIKMDNEIERLKSVLKETEHNLEIVQSNNAELKESKIELNCTLNTIQDEYSRLQNRIDNYITKNDELLTDVEKFREEIDCLKEQIFNKNLEIESMKEILSNFKREDENDCENSNEKSLNDLYEYVVKIQLESKKVEMERNNLNSKLEELTNECKQLNDRLVEFEESNKALKFDKESALQEKMKAILELEVLTKYYKEKELEFGKAIGLQQVRRLQKEENVTSLESQLLSLEEENISYKSQLQSMKQQFEETESYYKSLIIRLEKEVHQNWVLARTAEQKLEESKAEATALRETLFSSPIDHLNAEPSKKGSSSSSISSEHSQFSGQQLPPPPPLPPIFNFNSFMPQMHPSFNDVNNPSEPWNQSSSSMNVRPEMSDMYNNRQNNFTPIQTDNSMNNLTNVSFSSDNQSSHPLTYVPHIQQQLDSLSNRDTFSPSSHRSNGSSHSSSNIYTQPIVQQSHYTSPPSISSPLTNSMSSSMANHYHNMNTTVSSPLVNSTQPLVLSDSNPWMRSNGIIHNFNYSQTESKNESNNSSRPSSRNDLNSSHNSFV